MPDFFDKNPYIVILIGGLAGAIFSFILNRFFLRRKDFKSAVKEIPLVDDLDSSFLRSPRVLWFGLALLLFGLITFVAHRQAPRPDPFQPVQPFTTLDWWKYPVERNAFKRLPVITSNLTNVFALPNSEKVWAVGEYGIIVHSEDGGETWLQQYVQWEANLDSNITQALPARKLQQIDSTQAFVPTQNKGQDENEKNSSIGQQGPKRGFLQSVFYPSWLPVWGSFPALNSIFFANNQAGWVVGSHGTILVTKDGGQTWRVQTSGTSASLNSVYFVDAYRGWTVGNDGVNFATQDGGQSWVKQTNDISTSLLSVHFFDASIGWAVGGGGIILATKDGGKIWKAQKSGTSGWLSSIHFINARIGWAVGEGATVLATTNGGEAWETQTQGTSAALTSVHFIDPNRGWAVGWLGFILKTQDGGHSWEPQISGSNASLISVHFVDARRGWAVGSNGIILKTQDGGHSWNPQASSSSISFESVHFVNANIGWIVGDRGIILVTKDRGETWKSQRSRTLASLSSVHFVDADTGWTVSSAGTILKSQDGGRTWKVQERESLYSLSSVYFINTRVGWVSGTTGLILATQDGGHTWEKIPIGTSDWLLSIYFVDTNVGWVVGSRGVIFATQDGGHTWEKIISGTSDWLYSIYFVNDSSGWVVGDHGIILATQNGGQTWGTKSIRSSVRLRMAHFINTYKGWVIGDNGTILVTTDGGQTWLAQTSGTSVSLHSVHFIDASTGWAVGDNRIILATQDGGQTWKDSTLPYLRSFAPWYYLTWLFIAPLLYVAFKRPKPMVSEQKTVADVLVSDRPIAAGDPDPLEFNAIARGLSRFLRNENTQPPLTIAITGEWGSGKSSLMNLLKADLVRYGFRPVWFNAWHHQKEEHLLAALLQNIRKQALPRWWRPEGVNFRAQLFWHRIKRYWLLALLLVAGFAMAAGYFAAEPGRLDSAVQQLQSIFTDKETENSVLSWLQSKLKTLSSGSVLTLLSSVGAMLLVLWRSLRAFGVNPANLMASLSSNFKLSEVKAQMGFRHDFAREFSEVTAALNPRTMLILIDDLDRCRPENVLEVLEAVNFLVSSGDCFVVLGLDLQRVERCVGLGFKDVAEELVDEKQQLTNSEKEEAKRKRAEFARDYLEKLINIEVPVPQPRPEQSEHLIVPPEPIAPAPLLWWQNLLQLVTPAVRKVSPWLLTAAVVVAGFWFGAKQFSPQSKAPNTTTPPPKVAPSDTTSRPTLSTSSTPPTQREVPADSSRETGELIQPVKEPTSFTFVYIALAIMLGLGIWRLSIPTDLVVKDSPEFIGALKIWHPLLIAKRNTPRSVKRFVNRVRYFAMRQSAKTEGRSVWQKLLQWAGLRREEKVKEDKAVPESILVALSAIHHCNPKWIPVVCTWRYEDNSLKMQEGIPEDWEERQSEAGALNGAIKAHTEKFGNWPPSTEDRERLEKLSAGIRIN